MSVERASEDKTAGAAPAAAPRAARRQPQTEPPCYAALDLGTNNCRLLIATPDGDGFRVIESFSRIVRLGDGLSRTGLLDDDAMERTVAALHICADKIKRRRAVKVRAVATQACRGAANGADFIKRVGDETGIRFTVITPQEEAKLSVAGCVNLLDRACDAALVIDVGGGSTELSWVDMSGANDAPAPIAAWLSIPIGVVTLAERFPEGEIAGPGWFRAMVDHIKAAIEAFPRAEGLREVFASGRAHLVGTSGAITSLAGMHLGLRRYERSRVDGLWMSDADCEAAAQKLMTLGPVGRAAEPCIGPDRADLVLAGAAILQAVQELWPCQRVRVADRGLREGILLSMMAERGKRPSRGRRRKRSRGRGSASQSASAAVPAPAE